METPRFTIQCLGGPDQGKVWRDLTLPVRIGRGADCEVQINEPKLLPLHWQVEPNDNDSDSWRLVSYDGGEHIEDYLVDGKFIWPIIRPGDLFHMGQTVLLIGAREQIVARLERLKAAQAAMPLAESISAETPLPPPDKVEEDEDQATTALIRSLT